MLIEAGQREVLRVLIVLWRVTIVQVGSLFGAGPLFIGSQNALSARKLAHLADRMLLHLLQLFGLLTSGFETAPLHQDELCEEFGLLQEEVKLLPTF